jgi:hypothetical protein
LAQFSGCSRIRLPAVGLFEAKPATFGAELRTVIWDADFLTIITAYLPDPQEWANGFRARV